MSYQHYLHAAPEVYIGGTTKPEVDIEGNTEPKEGSTVSETQNAIPEVLSHEWMTEEEIRGELEKHLEKIPPKNIYILLNRLTYKGILEKGRKNGRSAWRKWSG